MSKRFVLATLAASSALIGSAEARGTPETAVMALINSARVAGTRCNGGGGVKLARMTYNATLARAADQHARNMAARRVVSHYFGGIGPRTRVVRAGYKFSRMSEIIFMGSGSASRAVRWWQNSRVHCQAMMNRYYTQVGAAYHNGAWVVVMALPANR
jgi:uncharacterized protein YkwD